MRRLFLLVGFCLFFSVAAQAQKVGIQTNALGWAAYGTLNVGVEPAITPRMTIAVDGYYNPFSYDEGNSTQMWSVQPEFRYWFKSKFVGHFVGFHGSYADYDFGMNKYRYDGNFSGLGLSYGYALALNERWRLNFNLGAGWQRKHYVQSQLPQWDDRDIIFENGGNPILKHNFGITKAAISVVFIIR